MHHRNMVLLSLCTTIAFACPPSASAQSGCSEELAQIDQRIASGNYPELNIMMAKQLRDSLQQICGFIDEEQKAVFVEQFEELLPTKSEEDRHTERRARADEQKAIREAMKRDEKSIAREIPPISPIIKSPPTAKSIAVQPVDRNEDMLNLWITDWDIYRDKARILYVTSPSLAQLGRPDWQVYVYVVEIASDGKFTQHLVTSKQVIDRRAIALRRGHDEIIFERSVGDSSENSALERWSISGKSLISSVPTPRPAGPDGKQWSWEPFRLATADGNVLFVANKKNRDGVSMLSWFEASPDGQVLGTGSVESNQEDINATLFFHTSNGGGGLIFNVNGRSETGIRSAVHTPIVREVAGREIRASVFSETRLLVTSDDAGSAWESSALGRTMIWSGDMGIPQTLPFQEVMRQQQEQTITQHSLEIEFDANRNINSLSVGLAEVNMIRPMQNGYGVLSTVSAERSLKPPIHGPYFLRVDDHGIQETAYLNPIAEKLKVRFNVLEISPNENVYVFGKPNSREDRGYVVRLDANGEVQDYGQTSPQRAASTVIEGMTADDSGVWLYGRQTPTGSHERLWFERIQFPQ